MRVATKFRGMRAAWIAIAAIIVAVVAKSAIASPDPVHIVLSNCVNGNCWITLEGSTGDVPDNCGADNRCGRYDITVRDAANNPFVGQPVTIDFAGCPDIRLACDQLESVTGQVIVGHQVTLMTDASGQVAFQIQGAASAYLVPGNATSPGTDEVTPCATVYAAGTLVGSLVVTAYDVNGTGSPDGAVNAADASLAMAEANKIALGAPARARDDLNFSGTITSADAAIYMKAANDAALGTGSRNTGPYCP